LDNVTHSLAGAALGAAGLRRVTPLATATLVVAANIPDIDGLIYLLGDPYLAMAHRRGITHGVPALLLWPAVVLGIMMGWDRWVRRRRAPAADPIRPRAIVLLAFLGALTHPILDWLNTYGLRWLMPLSDRWSYGDAVFIIDPWLWLALGGGLFLGHSRGWRGNVGWGVLFGMGTLLLLVPVVPPAARWVWFAGSAALVLARVWGGARSGAGAERAAAVGAMVAATYILALLVAGGAAARAARAAVPAAEASPVGRVLVSPLPANPLGGEVLAEVEGGYLLGTFHWFATPRVRWDRGFLPHGLDAPGAEAARGVPAVARFLVWARFPYAVVEEEPGGRVVRWRDARYAGERAGLTGPAVRLDAGLRPR
jgi:inner membrane protein